MIKAMIIDDEKSATDMMDWLLQTYCPDVTVQSVFNNPQEGLQALKDNPPDLLFLDIEMPGLNGFDLLGKLNAIDFQLVFTTAFDQFAVKAFKYAALNYLLKPVDPDELIETIQRFKQKKNQLNQEQLQILLENIKTPKKQVERIALSANDGLIFVKTNEIAYCQADSNYTRVKLADGRNITVARTLKDIDETLSGTDFARVHASFLVNINHIQKYVKGEGGYIVMPDGAEISISRNKREEFFQLFSKF